MVPIYICKYAVRVIRINHVIIGNINMQYKYKYNIILGERKNTYQFSTKIVKIYNIRVKSLYIFLEKSEIKIHWTTEYHAIEHISVEKKKQI